MTSPALPVAVAGTVLLCLPAAGARARLTRLRNDDPGVLERAIRPRRLVRPVAWLLAAAVAATAAGPGGVVAVLLLGEAVRRAWRSRKRSAERIETADALAEALRTMVAELRAGAHPVLAAESAAADAPPAAVAPMRAVALSARLGGDLDENAPATSPELTRLAQVWRLAREHGLPVADALDAFGRDLDAQVRFARRLRARMAGPRASATVLALLPCAGLTLGEAMGAEPLHVLTATGTGQVLLVLGAVLLATGLAWSARLTEQGTDR